MENITWRSDVATVKKGGGLMTSIYLQYFRSDVHVKYIYMHYCCLSKNLTRKIQLDKILVNKKKCSAYLLFNNDVI